MAAYVVIILVTTYLFCMVDSQFLSPVITRDYGCECGPLTSSITIIDNSMSLALANALQSMILNNFLDSSINLTPKYQNSEYLPPYSFVVESITYSPIIDTFYPCETPVYPAYEIYPLPYYTDVSPAYIPEPVPPVLYTETISFGPPPLPVASELCFTDLTAPNVHIIPVSCVNSYDVVPLNAVPPNSDLIDLILPPYGGYNDVYMPGGPFYFDNL